jgi:hypothetical protein
VNSVAVSEAIGDEWRDTAADGADRFGQNRRRRDAIDIEVAVDGDGFVRSYGPLDAVERGFGVR